MNTETLITTATPFHNARCDVIAAIHHAFRENPSDGAVSTKKRWLAIYAALEKAKAAAGEVGLFVLFDTAEISLQMEYANRRCDRWDTLEWARKHLDVLGRVP